MKINGVEFYEIGVFYMLSSRDEAVLTLNLQKRNQFQVDTSLYFASVSKICRVNEWLTMILTSRIEFMWMKTHQFNKKTTNIWHFHIKFQMWKSRDLLNQLFPIQSNALFILASTSIVYACVYKP